MILRIPHVLLLLLLLRVQPLSFFLQLLFVLCSGAFLGLSPCVTHLWLLFRFFFLRFWLFLAYKGFSQRRRLYSFRFFFLHNRYWHFNFLFLLFRFFLGLRLLFLFLLFFNFLFHSLVWWQLLGEIINLQIIFRWHIVTTTAAVTPSLVQEGRILSELIQNPVKDVKLSLWLPCSRAILSKIFFP